ncbi:FKBP prolyl isomerase 16 [Amia ocellicauda]|uniref:FKBP prolyl isomerase 16 n=1 Tax=Amia ocellicauda TaxID=2972642 RepID=UPI0034648B0D
MERPEFGQEASQTHPDVMPWDSTEESELPPKSQAECREACREEDEEEEEEEGEQGNSENSTSSGGGSSQFETLGVPGAESTEASGATNPRVNRKLVKTPSFGKTVRFQLPPDVEPVAGRESPEDSFFPDYDLEEWTTSNFDDFFQADEWLDITGDGLLRKRVLEPGQEQAVPPAWDQEVTMKLLGLLEDGTVVEKDPKLAFTMGEGDVNQALELCASSMRLDEIALLITDSQYAYGQQGRVPDIPPNSPLLYELQILQVRDKLDPLTLPASDCIRMGNQKRERGNFYFQREEYSKAAKSYCMALDILTAPASVGSSVAEAEAEELRDCRVKCLNNLAAAQLKLEQYGDALSTSDNVLLLDPHNVKALFRRGKLLSDKGEYQEAMETLKKAMKLEPSTKAIHVELSKLVKRQVGDNETQKWKAKPAQMLGENIAPFLKPSLQETSGIPWKLLFGALVVAICSLVTSMVLSAQN